MHTCFQPLLVLSLDTSTDLTTACISRDGEVLAEGVTRGRSTGAQHVLADIDHLLSAAGVQAPQVDLIVVGTGPGTFTGLRIGLSTATALGFALDVEVRGVGTLEALLQGDGVDVACVDARRGEVFALGDAVPLAAYMPEDLAQLIPPGAGVAGDGAVRYRGRLSGASIPPDGSPLHVPWARHHAALAEGAGPPTPLYVRAPDADRVLATRADA
jgi:tRNA threonylcarbamoyl adenosine modification protein YeaZ